MTINWGFSLPAQCYGLLQNHHLLQSTSRWCGKSEPFGEETSKLKHSIIKPRIKVEVLCNCTLSRMVTLDVWVSSILPSLSRIEVKMSFTSWLSCLTQPCSGVLSLPSQLSAAKGLLWLIRAVLAEDILAPIIRPSCGNWPKLGAFTRFSVSCFFSYM